MRKHYLISCLSFLTLIPFFDVFGQTTLIDAEFWPRLEYREGFRKPLVDTLSPMLVTVQRTRLNFEYSSALLNARLSIQDAHVWGNSNTKTNASLLSLYEAWFEYLITSGVSVKAGRQPLRYDDNRIFASPNWSVTGIVHDLLLLQYKTTLLQVHSGFAYNNAKDTLVDIAYSYANINTYKSMAFGWVSVQPFKNTSFSTMLLAEGFENPTNYETNYGRFTLGTYLNYESDLFPLSGSITAHFQQGNDMIKTVSSGGYAKLIAHFYASKASYEFAYKYTATLGIDFYSGSATTIDANKSNTYNRLYGALHNYNGYMEYYTKLPAQGLVNYYGSFNYKPISKVLCEITGHLFYFDKAFFYENKEQNKYLGAEMDLTLKYVVSKVFQVQGGYSKYFNSGTTKKYFKNDGVETRSQQWAYMMVSVKPQFYKTPPLIEK